MDLIRHLDLSDMWLGVDLRTNLKKYVHSKESGLCAQNILIILGSRGGIRLLNEHENLHLGKCIRYSYELQHIRGE